MVLGLVVLGIAAAVGTIALAGPPPQEPGFEVQTPSATVPPPSRTPPSGSCVQLSPDRAQVDAVVPCDGAEDATVVANVPTEVPCPEQGLARFEAGERALCLEIG